MSITFKQLIQQFIDGAVDGVSGTASNKGNLRIDHNRLIHYNTPILERYGEKYILNITRYSIQTGQLQKKIKEMIPEAERVDVKRVPADTSESLSAFIEQTPV